MVDEDFVFTSTNDEILEKEIYETLYQKDNNNRVRTWFIERDGNLYRVTSGLLDGEKVTSTWKAAVAKNVGKTNETSPAEQAIAEIKALYTKKKDKGYVASIDDVDKETTLFEPMLAQTFKKELVQFNDKIHVQPKLDGIRCIAKANGLFTRNGKEITSCPHISSELEKFFTLNDHLILDGELYNHELKDNFSELVSLIRKSKSKDDDFDRTASLVEYHVYDMYDTTNKTASFSSRIDFLIDIFSSFKFSNDIKLVDTTNVKNHSELNDYYDMYLEHGYEGQIVRINDAYQTKRTNSLLKRKTFDTAEFTILEVLPGLGNWSGCCKHLTLRDPEGRIFKSGIRGTQEYTRELLLEAEKYIGGTATVRYFGLTPDAEVPRFPVAIAIFPGERDL